MDNNEWALDNFSDVLEQDPLRILDVENDTQMLLNKIGLPSETERATSNFEKLAFGTERPETDTFTEAAGRIIPFIFTAGAGPLLKGGKELSKLAKSKAATKAFHKAAKKQLDNITNNKDLAKDIADSFQYFEKPSERPLAVKRSVSNILKTYGYGSDDALAEELAEPFVNPVAKYISDKAFLLGNSGATPDEIRSILLNEVDTISETSGMSIKDVNRIINERVNAKQKYNNLKAAREQVTYFFNKDVEKHPEVYQQFMKDKRSIEDIENMEKIHKLRYQKRLEELDRLNRSTIPNMSKVTQPTNEWNKILSEIAKPSVTAITAVKGPQATVDFGEKMLLNKEPEYKWYNAVSDTLKDIVGLDFLNPTRFNEDEINQYLKWAQDIGLLTSDRWKNWEPRQKIKKVAELASFINNSDSGYNYKTIYGDTRKELLEN